MKNTGHKFHFVTAENQSKQAIEQDGFSCSKIKHKENIPDVIIKDLNHLH